MNVIEGQGQEVVAADEPDLDHLRSMYESMATMTTADERISAEVRTGSLKATFYPIRGLEGVCAAMGAIFTTHDYLVSSYRNLGDAVAKGVPLRSIIAEVYGRRGGTSKGKGGPMHLHDISQGFMVTTGIVGSGLPIAVGLALAAQVCRDDRLTSVTFGDGATSIGAYHEAMNLAALWKLPILFICQNNQWAEHTPLAEYASNIDLAGRAASYGMTAYSVDGFDPIATWRVLRNSADSIRRGGGPHFVECKTYRLGGHTGSTDFSYMPEDELLAATTRDPAPCFRSWLKSRGLLDEAELIQIDNRVAMLVEDAFAYAVECPPPSRDEVFIDVFANNDMLAS